MFRRKIVLVIIILLFNIFLTFGQQHWGQFRGPNGGVSLEKKSLPKELDANRNLIWKIGLAHGNSSPVVFGNHIFLTGISHNRLETFAIDKNNGKILWQKKAWYEFIERVHQVNSPATPTPTTDGKKIFVYFGSSGLICYDYQGEEIWRRIMRTPPNLYGTASSLIIAGNRLVFYNDNQRNSCLETINKETGETIWKVDRKGFKPSWSTPFYWKNQGVEELVVYGVWWIKGYDLKDGTERWSLPGLTDEPIVTPVTANGIIYITSYNMKTNPEVIGLPKWEDLINEYDKDKDGMLSFNEASKNKSVLSRFDADGEGDHPLWGFHSYLDVDKSGKITKEEWGKMVAFLDSFKQENALLAIRPAGKLGDQTEVVWKHHQGVPECPSLLLYQGLIYMVKNGGILSCLDAKTGELKYRVKLGAGGPYYSSPVAGDGKVYIASARGVVTVVQAGSKFKTFSQQNLKERITATPAILDGKIFIRTEKSLYCYGLSR